MRISILVLICICPSVFGQKTLYEKVYFNGIYETKCDFTNDKEGDKAFIRFFPDQKVISVGTDCDATVLDLQNWFNLDSKNVSEGDYKIKNNKISFFTTSKAGTVKYKGKISKNGILNLKIKSLINGFRGTEEFQFKEIVNLK